VALYVHMGAIQPSWKMRILIEVRQHAGGTQSTRKKYVVGILVISMHVRFSCVCIHCYVRQLTCETVCVIVRISVSTVAVIHEGYYLPRLLFIQ
jgi:hypothetical protein